MGIHSNAIFSQITELLKTANVRFADIDSVLIGIGPGSYTGLRVVASSIKGMLFKSAIPLYGINTLAGFAACTIHDSEKNDFVSTFKIHSIIDARRNHLYYQGFNVTGKTLIEPVGSPELIEIPELYGRLTAGDTLIGTGIERLESAYLSPVTVYNDDEISARGLIRVYESFEVDENKLLIKLDPSDFEPRYSVEDFE